MTDYLIQRGKYIPPEEVKASQPPPPPPVQEPQPIVKPPPKKEKFGDGLKKGFFDNPPKPKTKTQPKVEEITTLKAKKTKESPLVIPEVQQAMHYLNTNTESWLTPNLLEQFAGNPLLARGLTNPRIMGAVEELKANPNLAKTKYQNDMEVQEFYREFSRIMASHFGNLAQTQGK
mmetsp:Transcript_12703/g.12823  ORF Transcript_12703/g.12823 Transcript_12703/m.12823 type:complete len:175 (-) Transcript_12703:26-550(-)